MRRSDACRVRLAAREEGTVPYGEKNVVEGRRASGGDDDVPDDAARHGAGCGAENCL